MTDISARSFRTLLHRTALNEDRVVTVGADGSLNAVVQDGPLTGRTATLRTDRNTDAASVRVHLGREIEALYGHKLAAQTSDEFRQVLNPECGTPLTLREVRQLFDKLGQKLEEEREKLSAEFIELKSETVQPDIAVARRLKTLVVEIAINKLRLNAHRRDPAKPDLQEQTLQAATRVVSDLRQDLAASVENGKTTTFGEEHGITRQSDEDEIQRLASALTREFHRELASKFDLNALMIPILEAMKREISNSNDLEIPVGFNFELNEGILHIFIGNKTLNFKDLCNEAIKRFTDNVKYLVNCLEPCGDILANDIDEEDVQDAKIRVLLKIMKGDVTAQPKNHEAALTAVLAALESELQAA